MPQSLDIDLSPEQILDEKKYEDFPTTVLGYDMSYKMLFELVALGKLTGTKKDTIYRELCKNDLYFLSRYVFNREDMMHEWVHDRARDIMARDNMTLDLWARFHYKTTLNIHGNVVRHMLKYPLKTQAVFSYNNASAEGNCRTIRNNLESNMFLQRLFPDVVPKGGHPYYTNSAITTLQHGGRRREASIMSFGVIDTMPTGYHFGRRNYDDIFTKDACKSPESIRNVGEMLKLSRNLKDPAYDEEMINGTRYHYGDTYGDIIENNPGSPRPHLIRIHPAIGTDGLPVLFSQEEIDFWRFEMGSYVFACQMMQDPKNPEDCVFDDQYLQTYDQLPEGFKPTKICLFCDPVPPSERARKGCYAVIMLIFLDANNEVWVHNCWSKIAPRPNEIEDQFVMMCRAHRPDVPAIEDQAMQILMLQTLKEKLRAIGYSREIQPLKTKGRSKDDRFMGLQTLWEQRRIHIRSSMRMLIDELLNYPHWKYRDHGDVFSYIKDHMSLLTSFTRSPNKFDRSMLAQYNRSRIDTQMAKNRPVNLTDQSTIGGSNYSWQQPQRNSQRQTVFRSNTMNPKLRKS